MVIGGGAAGLTAASEAARRGAGTVLVSEGPLGGECTHTGCIPSKTLIAAAAQGLSFSEAAESVRAAVARVAATEDAEALSRAGVRVIRGRACVVSPGRVDVDGTILSARHVIVATGSRASLPPVLGIDGIGALTNDTVFALHRLPPRLVVLGGGAIGCELAQAFSRLGSAVTLIEQADRVLPVEDRDASRVIGATFADGGICLSLATEVSAAWRTDAGLVLRLVDGHEVTADELIVAVGREPVSEGLGLEAVGVETTAGGHIVVDDTCSTVVPGIWAIGDVTERGGLTSMAAHMGFVAAANACRSIRLRPAMKVERRVLPRVTFCDPEVAQVGLTEAEAAEHAGRVAVLPLERVDRAVTSGQTSGFIKLIAGPRAVLGSLGGGVLLGATVVAPTAGEMISELALAMRTHAFVGRLAQMVHPYPSWSMAIQQAATQFFFEIDGMTARPARR